MENISMFKIFVVVIFLMVLIPICSQASVIMCERCIGVGGLYCTNNVITLPNEGIILSIENKIGFDIELINMTVRAGYRERILNTSCFWGGPLLFEYNTSTEIKLTRNDIFKCDIPENHPDKMDWEGLLIWKNPSSGLLHKSQYTFSGFVEGMPKKGCYKPTPLWVEFLPLFVIMFSLIVLALLRLPPIKKKLKVNVSQILILLFGIILFLSLVWSFINFFAPI